MASISLPTVTVRSRSPRTIYAAGYAITAKPITIAAAPTTLLDLWTRRRDLVIQWPQWVAPDGSCPADEQAAEAAAVGLSLAVMAAAAPPTPPVEPAAAEAPTALLAPASPASATVEPATKPTDDTPPLLLSDLPPQPPEPVWVRVAPKITSALVKPTGPARWKRTEDATIGAGLLGMLADQLKRTGLKPTPAPTERELAPGLTLERLLDSLAREGAGMALSRVQRALVRATDGRSTAGFLAPPDVAAGTDTTTLLPLSGQEHLYHFGTVHPLPVLHQRPRLVYLRSGIRSGKTLIAAIAMILCALTCSVRRPLTPEERAAKLQADGPDGMRHALQRGERIKVFLVTPKVSQSQTAYNYIRGALEGSPRLAKLLVKANTEELVIRRPVDGVEVVFRCEAASAQGNNLRSGWLAGALFDESAFFDDGPDAAVTLKDNVTAALSRLLPGGQVWLPSSPWADEGYWHDELVAVQKQADKIGNTILGETSASATANIIAEIRRDGRNAVAFHSSSRRLNPALPEGQEETVADLSERSREYDAIPCNAGSAAFFIPSILSRAINPDRTRANGLDYLPPCAGVPHYAGTDLAFRQNSSTLAIARNVLRKIEGSSTPVDVAEVVYTEELVPPVGRPMVPSEVVQGFGRTCQAYGCATMRGDMASVDTAIEALSKLPGSQVTYDAWPPTMERNTALFTRVRELMSEGRVDLPNDPQLIGQLKRIQGRMLPGGKYQIIIPRNGRAHCDLVVAVVHAIVQAADGASSVLAYEPSYDRYLEASERAMERTVPRDGLDTAGWSNSSGERSVFDF